MDRRDYKSKPFHLVTDPKTGEIKREVFPSDVDVGSQQIGANLKVYGTISGSLSGSAVTVRSSHVDVSAYPFSTFDFVGGLSVTDGGRGVAIVSGSGGGGSSGITVQSSGSSLPNNPHTTLNFTGSLYAVDSGGSVATISASGSAVTLRVANVDLASSPFSAINFLSGFSVTNVGNGVANILTRLPTTTNVVNNVAGNGSFGVGPTNWTGSYTSTSSGHLLIFGACGGYTNTNLSNITAKLTIDGGTVASIGQFFNSSGQHAAFPMLFGAAVVTAGSGPHALAITLSNSGAVGSADSNDNASITVVEF